MKIEIPCKDCLVFIMCKSRLEHNESVFNPSGLFAHLMGFCAIVREGYYKHSVDKYTSFTQESRLPYSEQAYPKAVLGHFDMLPTRGTYAG